MRPATGLSPSERRMQTLRAARAFLAEQGIASKAERSSSTPLMAYTVSGLPEPLTVDQVIARARDLGWAPPAWSLVA